MARTYGDMNAHAVGVIMREAVSRAFAAIRQDRFDFGVFEKTGSGHKHDIVTTADFTAQALYQKMLRECFPTFGIVAEEDHLCIRSSHPEADIYFTVDPIDGTKAWARGQSHGISTMLSLVCDAKVIAVAIGDINTQEIFYYRPESGNVWRIHHQGERVIAQSMKENDKMPLAGKYLLLRDRPEALTPGTQRLQDLFKRNGIFKDWHTVDGSIGLSMARLWKGEVGAHLLSATEDTPWDFCPILGISQKLGFEFLKIDPASGAMSRMNPKPLKESVERDYDMLAVHNDYVHQFLKQ